MIEFAKRDYFLLFLLFIFSPVCSAVSLTIDPISDISYGPHELNKMDVYRSDDLKNAPVIFMVHGGAWKIGDKSASTVVMNKVNRWVSKGFIFISVNYRLLPEAEPHLQVDDVISALAFAQKNVEKWGGDSKKFILMGHSSGAHLVSLMSVNGPDRYEAITPWLATVSIDSAVYDVEQMMNSMNTKRLYKKAFGKNNDYWRRMSPYAQLTHSIAPFLAICSLDRPDNSCGKAKRFVDKTIVLNSSSQLLPLSLSHRNTNALLGSDNQYTRKVEQFMSSLDKDIAELFIDN